MGSDLSPPPSQQGSGPRGCLLLGRGFPEELGPELSGELHVLGRSSGPSREGVELRQ